MPLLAFDTSTPCARVAVISDAGESLSAAEMTAARHSSHLLALCDQVLRAAGLKVSQVRALTCGAGPGSFTGLRVGLAVAKGLALADQLPLVLVSSLDALALDLADAAKDGHVLPCIDAGKGQVYARLYRTTQSPPQAMGDDDLMLTPEQLCAWVKEAAPGTALLAGGNGVDRYPEVFDAHLGSPLVRGASGPSARSVGRLALARLARGERDDLAASVPRYGRPPDITKPKKPG
jgi:tRNA threonylcarbamoyladenosine biosynthesis protein TsaB